MRRRQRGAERRRSPPQGRAPHLNARLFQALRIGWVPAGLTSAAPKSLGPPSRPTRPPGPRRRKVRLTPVPPDGKTCVRSLAPPAPTGTRLRWVAGGQGPPAAAVLWRCQICAAAWAGPGTGPRARRRCGEGAGWTKDLLMRCSLVRMPLTRSPKRCTSTPPASMLDREAMCLP